MGALRIARDRHTMRALEEAQLKMNTLLVSTADNTSPALSELVRGFFTRVVLIAYAAYQASFFE